MELKFEWDPKKARRNRKKHGISFELSSTVFLDPHALSVYDTGHSEEEDRWLTLGLSVSGALLVVHHTYLQTAKDSALIRIISSRRASKREQNQYNEGRYERRI